MINDTGHLVRQYGSGCGDISGPKLASGLVRSRGTARLSADREATHSTRRSNKVPLFYFTAHQCIT